MRAKRLLFLMMTLFLAYSVQGKSPDIKTTKGTADKASAVMNPTFVDYINNYRKLAIRQQKKYKIPASIILAQALLESNGGQSYLALAGNNHFGLKSTGWEGLSICKYDAGVYSCFRKYLYVYSSFEDHSRFISERSFYRPLFKLSLTDYKGWATGLNKCGYAKDPQYGTKLIRLIEQYHLYYYDTADENDSPCPPNEAATQVAKKIAVAPPAKAATPVRSSAAKTSSTKKK
jgi:flagellum-specific peptidoglycan hydrolase FlgJ